MELTTRDASRSRFEENIDDRRFPAPPTKSANAMSSSLVVVAAVSGHIWASVGSIHKEGESESINLYWYSNSQAKVYIESRLQVLSIDPALGKSHFFPDDIPGQMRTRRAQCGGGCGCGKEGGREGRIMGHIYVMSQLAERSNGIAGWRMKED